MRVETPTFKLPMVHMIAVYNKFNPRRACAARVTVVGSCLCVCLSVKSNLTSEVSVRPENAVRTQRATKVKNFSETAPLRAAHPPLRTVRRYAQLGYRLFSL